MNVIDFRCGTDIDNAACALVAAAPARGVFNGIPIRARYATTAPADIVREYHWRSELRRIVYRNSPRGKAAAAADAKDISSKQAIVAGCLATPPDFADDAAVLTWVETVALANRIGVDVSAVKAALLANGWESGVNVGEDFRIDDPRNFAGYIVGQWLHCEYDVVLRFIADWRAKFAGNRPLNAPPLEV